MRTTLLAWLHCCTVLVGLLLCSGASLVALNSSQLILHRSKRGVVSKGSQRGGSFTSVSLTVGSAEASEDIYPLIFQPGGKLQPHLDPKIVTICENSRKKSNSFVCPQENTNNWKSYRDLLEFGDELENTYCCGGTLSQRCCTKAEYDKGEKGPNMALILGLALGIPVGLLVIGGITAIVICVCCKRPNRPRSAPLPPPRPVVATAAPQPGPYRPQGSYYGSPAPRGPYGPPPPRRPYGPPPPRGPYGPPPPPEGPYGPPPPPQASYGAPPPPQGPYGAPPPPQGPYGPRGSY